MCRNCRNIAITLIDSCPGCSSVAAVLRRFFFALSPRCQFADISSCGVAGQQSTSASPRSFAARTRLKPLTILRSFLTRTGCAVLCGRFAYWQISRPWVRSTCSKAFAFCAASSSESGTRKVIKIWRCFLTVYRHHRPISKYLAGSAVRALFPSRTGSMQSPFPQSHLVFDEQDRRPWEQREQLFGFWR